MTKTRPFLSTCYGYPSTTEVPPCCQAATKKLSVMNRKVNTIPSPRTVGERIQQLLLTASFRFLSNVASDWLTVALMSPSSAYIFGKYIHHISPSIGQVFVTRQSGQNVHIHLPPKITLNSSLTVICQRSNPSMALKSSKSSRDLKCMLVLTLEGENDICTRVGRT